jgi:hypothetical protein
VKPFYPALSMCDLICSGDFERHPRLTLAIVEFELAWASHLPSSMDFTSREDPARRFTGIKEGMVPSDIFRRNVVLSFQEDAISIRLRDGHRRRQHAVGSDYPHSESTFPDRARSWLDTSLFCRAVAILCPGDVSCPQSRARTSG